MSEQGLTGFDIIFTYPLETPLGVVDLKGISTITDSDTLITIPGAAELECAGYYGKDCGKNPTPEFAGNYSASLTSCLLYTSPSPRDRTRSRMPSSA